jgi:hypothetical protein
LHMFQWLYIYVASVYSKCFICFRYMLQVFISDITYVAVAIAYVASVYCKYSTCFRCMLQKYFLLQHYTDTFAISKETRTLMDILHGNQLAEAKLSCTYVKLEIPSHITVHYCSKYSTRFYKQYPPVMLGRMLNVVERAQARWPPPLWPSSAVFIGRKQGEWLARV